MSKQTGAIVFSILFAVGTAGCASDPAPPPPAKVREGASVTPSSGIPPRWVTGELQRIEGDFYTVRDQSGREVRFQIDPRTRMDIDPKVGDRIRAEVAPQGYAYSISPPEKK